MTRRTVSVLSSTLIIVAFATSRLDAQGSPVTSAAPRVGQQRPAAPARAELERQFRERTAQVVRRRLQLNDDQMTRLESVNSRLDGQRSALVARERQTRQDLRAELTAGNGANQQKVASLLDQLMSLQRQRLDLVASEQRELSTFLTPVQRAQYFGLQNQMRKRMQELGDGGASGAGQRPTLRNPRLRKKLR
jgi:Spy/CpxP family protein refolding chaperone